MKRILAVDDSASMRQMVSFTLKKAGFDVTEAKDGRRGAGSSSPRYRAGRGARALRGAGGQGAMTIVIPEAHGRQFRRSIARACLLCQRTTNHPKPHLS